MESDDLILVITSKIRPIYTKWLDIRRNPTDFSKSDICRKIRRTTDTAFVTSSFKIFLTQTFPRCGATCYILPWRAMSQRFNGVNFGYRSVEVYRTFHSYLRVLVRIRYFHNGELHWRFGALCFGPFIR